LKRHVIARAQQGEGQAFAELFEKYKRPVYSLCLRIAESGPEAEDMTKELFLEVFREISTFQNELMFSIRLYQLTANAMSVRLQGNAFACFA
jgi:RNA polymerase sigma-70 factor (ECF subfamily)